MNPTVRRWLLIVVHPLAKYVPDLVCSDIDARILRTVDERFDHSHGVLTSRSKSRRTRHHAGLSAFDSLEAGPSNTSVYPEHADRNDSTMIEDAHATIFAVQPSTWVHQDDKWTLSC
ncbi:hypothetical protein [Halomontanus rarus]|uniref:hypothetical protein n=1 Tax=Halomontanus rarus TaxID=3034020 RepID=UPI0023E78C82|nr:hypothetical protein [Halovivax sp. TS33]